MEDEAVGRGPFQGLGVEAADVPAVGVGLDPVAVPAQRCEVGGAGLTRWAEGVVGLEVVQVHAAVGFLGAEREEFDGVGEFDAFADPVGDFVGVDADGVVEVDDGFDGVGAVADEFGQLVGEQGADAFGAQYAGAGGQGVVGEVDVDLGLSRAWPSTAAGGARAVGAGSGVGVGVGVVFDLGQAGVQGAVGGRVQGLPAPSSGSRCRPGSEGSKGSIGTVSGVSRGSGRALLLGWGASRSASSSGPGSFQSLAESLVASSRRSSSAYRAPAPVPAAAVPWQRRW